MTWFSTSASQTLDSPFGSFLGICLSSERPWRMLCGPFEGAAVIATIKRIMVKTSGCAAELRPTHQCQSKRPKQDSSLKFIEALWRSEVMCLWSLNSEVIIHSKARQRWTYTRYRSSHRPYSSSLRLQPTWHHTSHCAPRFPWANLDRSIQPVRWCLGGIWVHLDAVQGVLGGNSYSESVPFFRFEHEK